jgi:lipoyl(octanoyl) transferase
MSELAVHRLGLVEYADGLQLQKLFGEARSRDLVPDSLLLLEHPPVLTLGRGGKRENILVNPEQLEKLGVDVFETNRGGDVTYHGPGQIVGYPILQLPPGRRDVRRYVRDLEESIIRALSHFGIAGIRVPQWPGVWVGTTEPQKIAALGVHISRWQTSHGFALNVNTQLSHFDLIVPCGIREHGVASMQDLLGAPVSISAVEEELARAFASIFDREIIPAGPRLRTVSVCLIAMGKESQVLLLHRRPEKGGFWQTITGYVDGAESPEGAAIRELSEETGLSLPVRHLGYRHSFALGVDVPPKLVQESAFAAAVEGAPNIRLDPSEHDQFAWVSVDEALQKLPYPGLKKAVRLAVGWATAAPEQSVRVM